MAGPVEFVDAEVIKAKLDEILEAVARIEGHLEALEAQIEQAIPGHPA